MIILHTVPLSIQNVIDGIVRIAALGNRDSLADLADASEAVRREFEEPEAGIIRTALDSLAEVIRQREEKYDSLRNKHKKD